MTKRTYYTSRTPPSTRITDKTKITTPETPSTLLDNIQTQENNI